MHSFLDNKTPLMERVYKLNWRWIYLILILSSIGFVMLYSAAGGSFFPWLIKQLIYFFIFFVVMIFVAVTDIKIWFKLAYPCYLLALIALIVVDVMGHNSMGATRWVKLNSVISIQPSEIMKICMIFALAKYFYNIDAEEIQTTRFVIMPLLMIAVPAYFIFDQPDLGTASILVMVGVTLLFVAGVKIWKFIAVGVAGLVALPILWGFVLYDYQKDRILNFLNPNNDPLGSGYNIIQSKIAIGSGGFYGKGLLGGTQGQLDFLPERQTDFIFTMLSEELGFIGSVFTIAIYSMIIYVGTSIALKTKHQFGRLLVMGVMTIFFVHMFVNIGMVTGIIPVVGAPLPLISYGGTITATILIGFGLVLNVDLYDDVDLKI